MDIDEMPAGRELDALVAEKVMGYSVYRDPAGYMYRFVLVPQNAGPDNPPFCDTQLELVQPFSTDIAAAWQVVTKMRERDYWVFMGIFPSYSYVLFTEDKSPLEYRADTGVNEVPLAICRAALKAVET